MSKRPLIPNKLFSWVAIGIIIYVLFFQKNQVPDGQQVTGIQHIFQSFSGAQTQQPSENPAPPPAGTDANTTAGNTPAAPLPVTADQQAGGAGGSGGAAAQVPTAGIQQQNIDMAKAQFTTSLLDILQSVVGPVGKDISEGEGEPVLCGQKVTVSYAEFLDGKQIFATPQDAPLTFTVGNGEVMKGLEIGVIGMKKGGERHILVPPAFGHDDPRFHRDDVKPNIKTDLDVKLDEYKPGYITTKNGMGIKIYDDADGHTKLAYCGNKVIVDYKIWDMDGKLLASTLIKDPENKDKPSKEEPGHGRFKETIAQPVIWQLGNGKAPYAFDIGITGDGSKHAMKVGGKRTIIAPANFLKTMTGGKPSADILEAKLPNKTLLIELELRDLSN